MKKMRENVHAIKLFAVACCGLLISICSQSQTLCKGSLGDPVVKITFGAGAANPGPPLAAGTTTYNYVNAVEPNDGSYSIANKNSGAFADSWHALKSDHTGDKNGYYMIVNADEKPGDFYTVTVHGLCGNTTYEFAAWIINLLKLSNNVCGDQGIKPNLTFSIEKLDGKVITSIKSGDIPATDDIEWKQYGTLFTTQPNVNDVVIRITNNAPGGCGNDLALDDITFRPCGPAVNIKIKDNVKSNLLICPTAQPEKVTLNGVIQTGFEDNIFQWQRSSDGGKTWIDLENETGEDIHLSFDNTTTIGTYLYRVSVGNPENIGSVSCRAVSNIDTVVVGAYPAPQIVTNSPVCAGNDITMTATGGATYSWTKLSYPDFTAGSNIVVIKKSVLANAGTYKVVATSADGCVMSTQTAIIVNETIADAGKDVTICEGASTKLLAKGGDTYNWQPASSLSVANMANPDAQPGDTTAYIVTVTKNNCPVNDTVIVNVVPKLQVTSNSPICAGADLVLTATRAKTFNWAGPDGFSSTQSSITIPAIATKNAGAYTVTDPTNNLCPNKADVSVEVFDPHAIAGEDITVCEGTDVTLQGSGDGSFDWSPSKELTGPGTATPSFTASNSDSYYLTVTKGNCTGKDTVNVKVIKKPIANAGADMTMLEGQTIQLHGSISDTGITYFWTPESFMNDAHNLTPVVSPGNDITYTLHAVSDAGCGTSTDDMFVKVFKKVVVPNAFSPNGDGVHDTWIIEALATYPGADVEVFNRYGQVVYHSIGYSTPWNGMSNGKPLPLGTYYYVINLEKYPRLAGWVSIIK